MTGDELKWCYDWVDNGGDSNNSWSNDGFEFKYGGDNNYGVRVHSTNDCQSYHDKYTWTDKELADCKALFD